MPEGACPYCKQELETAEMRNPPGLSEPQSGWFYFKDGSHVIGGKESMAPRRCHDCRRQWLHHQQSNQVLSTGF